MGYNTHMWWQSAKNQYHLTVSLLANIRYGFPGQKLQVIGVTGTSGKTTTTHMIYEVLKAAGYKVSMLSSIKAVIGGKEYDTGFHITTPDPENLPKYLREALDGGDSYFVLEVSSHGLDQNRAAFIPFTIGVLTSLAHEHLDYHKNFENYARAKFKLLFHSEHAIIPAKDVAEKVRNFIDMKVLEKKLVTFGMDQGDQTQKDWKLNLSMPGTFNLLNALAAASVGQILGVPKATSKIALENFAGLTGRFEEMPTGKDFRVIIDFAHKPDALEQAISATRDQLKDRGRVIVMYGCASQRDVLKRPMMGEISGRLAEITVFTDEDPRFENPMKIIDEMAQGAHMAGAEEVQSLKLKVQSWKEHVYFKIPNRNEAIAFIITKLAKPGDIILLCGKGHEQSINYNGVETPWSEHKAVEEALKLKK